MCITGHLLSDWDTTNSTEMRANGNGNNQWECEGNGNKTWLNLRSGIKQTIGNWIEWDWKDIPAHLYFCGGDKNLTLKDMTLDTHIQKSPRYVRSKFLLVKRRSQIWTKADNGSHFVTRDPRDPSVSWSVTRMTRDPWPSPRTWHKSITTRLLTNHDEFTTIAF